MEDIMKGIMKVYKCCMCGAFPTKNYQNWFYDKRNIKKQFCEDCDKKLKQEELKQEKKNINIK